MKETLSQINELVESGDLMPVVSEAIPLSEIKKGHQMIESNHTRGKIILEVASA